MSLFEQIFNVAGVSATAYWAACAAVVLGAVAQRATGQAFGMIVAPVVALAAPDRAPASVLLLGVVVTMSGVAADFSAIVWRELTPAVAGRIIGAGAAALAIAAAPSVDWVAALVAIAVLAGAGLSLRGGAVPINPGTLLGAGFASGLMGTLTSVGAPPMGLLYQQVRGARVRATLNAFFLLGIFASLTALWSKDLISIADGAFALSLAPALAVGLIAARFVIAALDGRSLRPVILMLAAAAALTILARLAIS